MAKTTEYYDREYTLSKLKAKRTKSRPRTLKEAVEAFAADLLSEKVMSKAMYQSLVNYKQRKWSEYHAHVL